MKKQCVLLTCLTVLISLSTLPSYSAPNDWPQWRGPNRDGISQEKGLLKTWPTDGPRLIWKATGLGKGYSTVAIADGKIFTTGESESKSSVHALDLAGKKLWSSRLGKPGQQGGYDGPRGTPTVVGGQIYALGQFGDLVCIDGQRGQERWRRHLQEDFDGRCGGWGYAESPLIDGIKLICSPGGSKGTMVALNRVTGNPIWRTTDFTDSAEYSSAILKSIEGAPQYIQLTGKSVVGISSFTGNVLWKAPRRGRTAVIPDPIYSNNRVYVTSGYGVGCNMFEIQLKGTKFEASEVYANKVMVNHHGGVVLLDGHLYGYSDGKGWTCQNLETGEVLWAEKNLDKGSLTYADGHFYLRSERGKGTVVLLEATTKGWVEKGRFDQPDRSRKNSWAHPVISNGRLYLRDQDILLCYDISGK